MNKLTIETYRLRYGDAADFIWEYKTRCGGSKLPWVKTYNNIRGRCENPKVNGYSSYGGRGVKCLITPRHLKETFFRDKAWLLKQPSVDRIDPDGAYALDNIRWIEHSENSRMSMLNHPKRVLQYVEFRECLFALVAKFKWNQWILRRALYKVSQECGKELKSLAIKTPQG